MSLFAWRSNRRKNVIPAVNNPASSGERRRYLRKNTRGSIWQENKRTIAGYFKGETKKKINTFTNRTTGSPGDIKGLSRG